MKKFLKIYAQTPATKRNLEKFTTSQKFITCEELASQSAELWTNESEINISDTELIECCNEAEKVLNESNNKTIVDMIYDDFSTSPFNSPITSPASRLKALERSPLFILLEKPKRCYGLKFKKEMRTKLEEKLEFIVNYDDNSDEGDLVPIEDTLTAEQLVDFSSKKSDVPSNHGKSDPSKNWGEDDYDIFTSIDMQQILNQNEQFKESFFIEPVLPLKKYQTQELKNEKESIKINNRESSLTHLHIQTPNNNQNAMSEEKEHPKSFQGKDFGTEPKEITKRISVKSLETKFKNTTDNSVQITDKTGFRTANGKDISISEEEKKRLEGLLKELNQSASDDNTEVGLLDIKKSDYF
uniref:Uncharacterized protein n=1 Tax=Glossina brevipalpis TaxID=37001 RepID=A0A1A9WBX7_9MUSC